MSQSLTNPVSSPAPAGWRRPEILAPAGNSEMMHAAVENGADAIYFGLDAFNARLRADNFTLADLPETMAYLHERGVKGFVTLNTLIFPSELPDAADFLKACSQAGVDAIIVQDLGLAALASRLVPDLPIHASTQMTLTCAESIDAAEALGLQLERVVAPRENSVKELAKITKATTKDLEVFVHGAICVAYSGQCLTSEALGGRSANRGECAQACRLPYDLLVDGQIQEMGDVKYLLSPKDLAAWADLDEMVRAGVASLKIEGRLKSPQYVAATVQSYRAALDQVFGQKGQLTKARLDVSLRHKLEMTFSRGFTGGYLHDSDHQAVVEGRFPKKRGLFLGKVKSVSRNEVTVRLEGPLKPGDGVVFDGGRPDTTEDGGRVVAVAPVKPPVRGKGFKQPASGTDRNTAGIEATPSAPVEVLLTFDEVRVKLRRVRPGDLLWKTSDPEMDRELSASYEGDQIRHRLGIHATVEGRPGLPLILVLEDEEGYSIRVEDTAPADYAQHQPLGREVLEKQIGRLGNTPFELRELTLKLTGDIMVPFSRLNDLRRRATEALIEERRRIGQGRRLNKGALERMRGEITTPPRGTGILPVNFNTELADNPINKRLGAYLPHWTSEEATYAVTFRLADSLPAQVIEDWRHEREALLRVATAQGKVLSGHDHRRLHQLYSERVEKYLDAGSGACWLARPEIAEITAQALKHFDGERYDLLSWCVMPNHVHVLVKPRPGYVLEKILHSWKSFIALAANKLLNRHGDFWQAEYYDHLIRDDEDFARCVSYILENPRKVGLQNWKWVSSATEGLLHIEVQHHGQDAHATIEDHGQDAHATVEAASPVCSMAQFPELLTDTPQLAVLCRSLEQVEAAAAHSGVTTIYTDFEDQRRVAEARGLIPRRRADGSSGPLFVPATLRVIKPGEIGFTKALLQYEPDAVLVRNLASWHFLRQSRPELTLFGDYSLNVANDLTAALLKRHGFAQLTPSYDLNIDQLLDLLGAAPSHWFEVTIHQRLPMFHMEHCVFCRFLSEGTNHTNCGRPCDTHTIHLRDRVGYDHPVKADAGCRNTVYNAVPQSASEYLPQMRKAGVFRYRIELIDESAEATTRIINAYLPAVLGKADGSKLWRELKASSKLGVTRGSLDHE